MTRRQYEFYPMPEMEMNMKIYTTTEKQQWHEYKSPAGKENTTLELDGTLQQEWDGIEKESRNEILCITLEPSHLDEISQSL